MIILGWINNRLMFIWMATLIGRARGSRNNKEAPLPDKEEMREWLVHKFYTDTLNIINNRVGGVSPTISKEDEAEFKSIYDRVCEDKKDESLQEALMSMMVSMVTLYGEQISYPLFEHVLKAFHEFLTVPANDKPLFKDLSDNERASTTSADVSPGNSKRTRPRSSDFSVDGKKATTEAHKKVARESTEDPRRAQAESSEFPEALKKVSALSSHASTKEVEESATKLSSLLLDDTGHVDDIGHVDDVGHISD